jgi:hypothetical protein
MEEYYKVGLQGLPFGVYDLGFRVEGLRFKV